MFLGGRHERVERALQRAEPQTVIGELAPLLLDATLVAAKLAFQRDVLELLVGGDEGERAGCLVDLPALDAHQTVLDLVEDRLVGIKSREIYEAPGALALITAHQELENVTLERELGRYKRGVEQKWGELTYDGLWFSPLKRSLDAFVASTQEHVSGDIRMTLHGGRAVVTGRRSKTSLYDFNLATYDELDTFDQSQAKGFIHLHGLSSRIAAGRDQRLDT